MAREGYHPDYVFALHHIVRTASGEQSKFAAFFSGHPRWETRDQRDDRAYADALSEYNNLWPNSNDSPGGRPPLVAFLGKASAEENKAAKTADLTLPIYCRNSTGPLQLVMTFNKDHRPVQSFSQQYRNERGVLVVRESFECSEKTEAVPLTIQIPGNVVGKVDRKVEALVEVYAGDGTFIEAFKPFTVHFPKS